MLLSETVIIAIGSAMLGMLWKLVQRITAVETKQEFHNGVLIDLLSRLLPNGEDIRERYDAAIRTLAG